MTENNLINRILSDAESSAAAIVEKARQSADESVRQAQEKALQTQQKLFVELEQERRRTLERRATVAEIDAKKEVLAARVRCIDMAFSRAEEKLCDIDTATYLAFIEAMLDKYADDGDVVVVARNAKVDREDIKRLAVFGEKHLTLGEDGDFSGGLVLSGKKYDKSLTFKSLLQETRSVLQSEVFAKLVKR